MCEGGVVALETTSQPALQALSKVADSLGERAWDRVEHVGDEEVHDALVEGVVTGVDVLHHRMTGGEEEELLLRQVLVSVIVCPLVTAGEGQLIHPRTCTLL